MIPVLNRAGGIGRRDFLKTSFGALAGALGEGFRRLRGGHHRMVRGRGRGSARHA